MKKIFVLTIIVIMILATNAYAYLDPSTTTYVLQIILAVIIGLGTTFAMLFHKIKRCFKPKNENEDEDEDEDEDRN